MMNKYINNLPHFMYRLQTENFSFAEKEFYRDIWLDKIQDLIINFTYVVKNLFS